LDALPPSDPPAALQPGIVYTAAPGDIHPRDSREAELCGAASHPDWLYLGGLVALDAGGVLLAADVVKTSSSEWIRYTGPAAVGLTWGATVGGAWLALPKCSPNWVGESPMEGGIRASAPLALSLALLAGATAPIVTGIAVGTLPTTWSTLESQMHLVVAGIAGAGGALLPYLLPPKTFAAARELEHIRFEVDPRGTALLTYGATF
jgi:hypothetical protein